MTWISLCFFCKFVTTLWESLYLYILRTGCQLVASFAYIAIILRFYTNLYKTLCPWFKSPYLYIVWICCHFTRISIETPCKASLFHKLLWASCVRCKRLWEHPPWNYMYWRFLLIVCRVVQHEVQENLSLEDCRLVKDNLLACFGYNRWRDKSSICFSPRIPF